jgi:hypothetical protein
MDLSIVASGLLAHEPARLAAQPHLARLAALASVRAEPDLDSALLRSLELESPSAPLAALGAGIDVGDRWVIRVDPVTMIASHDDVRIEARVDDLDAREAERIVSRLAAHFAEDGLAFAAPRADAWFALSRTRHDVETTPLARAIGRPLRGRLPRGSDASRWRRWLTEAQMLLSEDALAQRARRPLTGVWFEGGGALPLQPALGSLRVEAPAGRAGDVARGLAKLAGVQVPAPSTLDAGDMPPADHRIVVVDIGPEPSAIDVFASDVVAPALSALRRGRLSAVALCADRADFAASWSARRPSLVDRWLSRNAPFAVPAGEPE